MRKRKERMKDVTKGCSRSRNVSTSRLTSTSQHKPSYVTTTPPTVSSNVTFKPMCTKVPIPAVHCSNGFLWLAASRREKEELISGNSCCCCVCWAWIPALFWCASLCRNFPHSPAQRGPQGSEHLDTKNTPRWTRPRSEQLYQPKADVLKCLILQKTSDSK